MAIAPPTNVVIKPGIIFPSGVFEFPTHMRIPIIIAIRPIAMTT